MARVQCVRFSAGHLMAMALQPSQEWLYELVGPYEAAQLEGRYAFTGLVDGEPVICGGAMEVWAGRALLWAYLSPLAGPHMRVITRGARDLIAGFPFKRLEAAVECDFENGHKWARLLGLELETPRARKYLQNGKDCAIYTKVRD